MNARLFLHECERRGVSVRADGDRLVLRGPTSSLPADMLACAKQQKRELLALVCRPGGGIGLVHTGGGLVHKLSPHAPEGGLAGWTSRIDVSRGEEGGKENPKKSNHRFSPLSPLSPHADANVDTRSAKIISHQKGGFPSPDSASDGGENYFPYNNVGGGPESGLSGLSGLPADEDASGCPSAALHVGRPFLTDRWGPGLTDDGPGLDVHPPMAASEAVEPDPGPELPDSCFSSWPPRAPELVTWPVGWRGRWSCRSAELEVAGYPTWEAERHAFAELVAERIGLGLGAKGIPGERDLVVPVEPATPQGSEAADARPSRAAALPLKGGR